MHGYKPVAKNVNFDLYIIVPFLSVMPIFTVFTLVSFLILFAVMRTPATFGTNHANQVVTGLKLLLATFLARKVS
ncbi:hypothetical protein HW49_08970 [Porphyromonadaceae bacterium COT-184 OH4590]|nr:hypothetical protein HW49_08970 [Porphyromonadaceae bacterium COT-184 OH4590]